MRLVELDGRRAGPVDRGECTDFLKVRCGLFDLFESRFVIMFVNTPGCGQTRERVLRGTIY
jgi:hypothetical protein